MPQRLPYFIQLLLFTANADTGVGSEFLSSWATDCATIGLLLKKSGEGGDIPGTPLRSGSQGKRKGYWRWVGVRALSLIAVSAVALVGFSAGNFVEREAATVEIERRELVDVPSVTENEVPFERMDKPLHYNSGNASEKVTELPVPTSADATHKRVIFSLAVPDLSSGDVLQVMSEFQVTNDLGFNVMCMTQIILADSETAVSATEITEANGRNVTPAAHHDSFPKVGSLTVTTTGTKHVNVVAWCAASKAATGSTITVDADYGRLSILRY